MIASKPFESKNNNNSDSVIINSSAYSMNAEDSIILRDFTHVNKVKSKYSETWHEQYFFKT